MAYHVVQQNLEAWLARRRADWCGSGAGVVWRVVWSTKSVLQTMCIFRMFRVSNLREHQTKAVFDQKLIVGRAQHKVVLDESGFRAYCVRGGWGLNLLSVGKVCTFE